jgi:hypothetical protein
MLPPFIIDQIRRREEEERARQDAEQPRLEIPADYPRPAPTQKPRVEDDVPRGVVILDLCL